jgi:hypothetical protein
MRMELGPRCLNSGSGVLPRPSCELAKRRDFLLLARRCAARYIHVPGRRAINDLKIREPLT